MARRRSYPRTRTRRVYVPARRAYHRARSGIGGWKGWIAGIGLAAVGVLALHKFMPGSKYTVPAGLALGGVGSYFIGEKKVGEGLISAGVGLAAADYVATRWGI